MGQTLIDHFSEKAEDIMLAAAIVLILGSLTGLAVWGYYFFG